MLRPLAALLIPLAVCAEIPAAKEAKLRDFVMAEMAKAQIPGASIAIATGGRLEFAAGFGFADLENAVPMSSQTRIRLGSISKPITAVAVLQLVEQGRIRLDAEVQEYLPSFPKKQWPVTVRHLLGHLAGIRHYKGREIDSVEHYPNRLEPLKIFQDDPLLFEPGTRYSYTTYGYNLLGAIVEAVAGDFVAYTRDKIFLPAGMDAIGPDQHFEIIRHRSRGYTLHDGRIVNCGLADTSNKIPGGGFLGTATDLVRFALAVDAHKVLKAETVRMMWTGMRTADGRTQSYGMGWNVVEQPRKMVGHSGGQQGTSTMLLYFPNDDTAVAVMLNRDNAPASEIARGIANLLFEAQ